MDWNSSNIGMVLVTSTSCSGCGKSSGCSSTASTAEKMVVFAAIPNARVSTATMVKPGLLIRRPQRVFEIANHLFLPASCRLPATACYSCRSACIGSTRIALRAGK